MSLLQVRKFEDIAAETWERLGQSFENGIPFSEETLTDLNILNLVKAKLPGISVFKSNKSQESKYGFDVEFWIGSDVDGWCRLVVQAKKVNSDGEYASLEHAIGNNKSRRQIDVLEEFARINKAIPLYCFYNYSEVANQGLWHCCSLAYEESQLGCSIIPAHLVRDYLTQPNGVRTFEGMHQEHKALPWRCLVGCPKAMVAAYPIIKNQNQPLEMRELSILPGNQSLLSMLPYHEVTLHRTLPNLLQKGLSGGKIAPLEITILYQTENYAIPYQYENYLPNWIVTVDQNSRLS